MPARVPKWRKWLGLKTDPRPSSAISFLSRFSRLDGDFGLGISSEIMACFSDDINSLAKRLARLLALSRSTKSAHLLDQVPMEDRDTSWPRRTSLAKLDALFGFAPAPRI